MFSTDLARSAGELADVVRRTGEDEHVLNVLVLDIREQPRVLAHSVGGALEPLGAAGAGRLRGSQHLDKALAAAEDAVPEVVSARHVAVQGGGVELHGRATHASGARFHGRTRKMGTNIT